MTSANAPTIRPAAVCPTCGNLLVPTERGMECFTHGLPTTETDVEKGYRLFRAQEEAWTAYIAVLAPMSQVDRDALRRRIAEEEQ